MQPSWSHTTRRGSAPNWPAPRDGRPARHGPGGTGPSSRREPGEPAHPGDHPQLGAWPNPTGIATSGCHRSHWASSPGKIGRALARIRRHEQRAQLGHPVLAGSVEPCSQPIRSAITVAGIAGNSRNNSDHLRLHRVDHRALRRPLIARRPSDPQRRPHRVPGHPKPTGDRLDPHPLGPMQPTDLRPLLHVDHPPCLLARLEPGFEFHHIQWWTRQPGEARGIPAAERSVTPLADRVQRCPRMRRRRMAQVRAAKLVPCRCLMCISWMSAMSVLHGSVRIRP